MWPPDDPESDADEPPGPVAVVPVDVRGEALAGLAGVRANAPPPLGAGVLAALHPGRRAIKPLAALAAVLVLVAGFVAWRSRPQAEPVAAIAPASSALALVSSSGPSPSPSATLLVVAVTGRVRHPGLVQLVPGARVADAIRAAGGALPGTDLSFVNLARKVADGELIVIGLVPPPGVTANGGAPTADATSGRIIDLNTATAADLDTLPGIGPALAQRIIDYRTQHGGFRSVDELRNVSGIGDTKFAEIKDLVSV